MTDWDAALYLKFEKERTRPAIDLLARISIENPRTCVDIGCGPGNATELLVNRFPEANITGLDQSPDMLAAAKLRLPHVDFEQIDLTHWRPGRPNDVIFASASLQWLPDQWRRDNAFETSGAAACEMERKQVIATQSKLLQVYFIRHGETAWSLSGQHTGRTTFR